MNDIKTEERTSNILVVDDEPANLELLGKLLGQLGHDVRLMPNGRLALESARAEAPDLILMDVNLPEMDGFEVCRQCKQDAVLRDVPVIFLTVHDGAKEKAKAFSAGAVDYVTKPYHLEEIVSRVAAHVKIRALQKALAADNDRLEHLVAQRTRELADAYKRVVEMGWLKDEFLQMISHELRTPANGVLGVGELMLDVLPDTDHAQMLRQLFVRASQRMRDLIEDATMLARIEQLEKAHEATTSLHAAVQQAQEMLPKTAFALPVGCELAEMRLGGDPVLLGKAIATLMRVAAAGSKEGRSFELSAKDEGAVVFLKATMDNFRLTAPHADEYFKLESPARGSSGALDIGLAPAVAQRILAAFGGNVCFFRTGEL